MIALFLLPESTGIQAEVPARLPDHRSVGSAFKRLLHSVWLVQPAARVGGLALDREGSSRCARSTQPRYDESGRPWPHNRVVVSSAVAMLRGNVRGITLTPAAQASGEWHGPPTLPAQFKALRG
jgi:hypothetical protein